MSEENVALARRLTELLAADDPQAAAEFFAPDAELQMRLGSYSGRDGVAEWQRDVRDLLGDFEFTASEFLDVGDTVVHLARVRAHGTGGELEVEQELGFVMRFAGGKCVAASSYPSHREARAAAELTD